MKSDAENDESPRSDDVNVFYIVICLDFDDFEFGVWNDRKRRHVLALPMILNSVTIERRH